VSCENQSWNQNGSPFQVLNRRLLPVRVDILSEWYFSLDTWRYWLETFSLIKRTPLTERWVAIREKLKLPCWGTVMTVVHSTIFEVLAGKNDTSFWYLKYVLPSTPASEHQKIGRRTIHLFLFKKKIKPRYLIYSCVRYFYILQLHVERRGTAEGEIFSCVTFETKSVQGTTYVSRYYKCL